VTLAGDEADGTMLEVLEALVADVYPLTRRSTPNLCLLGCDVYVDLRIYLEGEPTVSDGEWNAAEKRIEWTRRIGAYGAQVYAVWADPDRGLQTKHLGGVRLAGAELGQHAMYFSTLTPEDQQAWRSFVETLEPGPTLAARLRAFRLPSERESEAPKRSEEVTSHLLRALEPPAHAEPAPAGDR
jgi:hypothetical protein